MSKKVKALSILATLALTASMAVPAFAANEEGEVGGAVPTDNGTQVWAGVAVDDPDTRIKVTVPTMFAFVVNGTADQGTGENTAITVENDALLLPNVKVTDYDAGAGTYNITTTGDSKLEFVNYSTKNDTSDERVGLQVTLKGSIRNEGTTASRNGWTHVGSAPTTDTADAKKYQLVVNGEAFTPGEDGIFSQATGITLNAPDLNNGNLDATTQLALDGSVTEANFSVNVGGDRYDYKTVEDSAQIGTISWIITSQNTVPVGP